MSRRRLQQRDGFTLIEVLIGTAIASLIIGLLADMGLNAYRYQREDRRTFASQETAVLVSERIVRDVREAAEAKVLDREGTVLSLTGGEEIVTYEYEAGALYRHSGSGTRVIARLVESPEFRVSGKMVTFTITVANGDGETTYELPGQAALRGL